MDARTVANRVVGFIDIGTNSVRILVVRIEKGVSYSVLTRQKEVVRLGEGEFRGESYLTTDAMDRATIVVRRFAELARSFGAEEIVAVATSATREAKNQGDFIAQLRGQTGIDVHVISGREEARLTYLGVSSGLCLDSSQALFIDIGGGSTEFAVGDQRDFVFLDSKKLGALRIAALFPPDNKDGSISGRLYAKMKDFVTEVLADTIKHLHSFRIDYAVGSSGTLESLAEITMRRCSEPGDKRQTNGQEAVECDDLQATVAKLRSLPLAERKKVAGMNPDRADIIIQGAVIIEVLMEALGLTELRVSDRGLREGLLLDYLSRMEGFHQGGDLSVRRSSVLRQARRFNVDETHANTTARLALELFDSAKTAGLHTLGDRERDLLEYAAVLHDVGTCISYNNHDLHSYYIIRNTEFLGFDDRDILIIALVARYHRRYLSPKHRRRLTEMKLDILPIVKVLANLLCLANSLDRSHSGVIRSVSLQKKGEREITIVLEALGDCHLEIWGIELHREDFEKTFKQTLAVDVRYI
ncbi:MAG: Ppx/GppA family phosphatase [Methanomicrobiales archaeon]|nr:Ppx/GppA family phosphatase [Methanomicrobiales archaeon]